MPRPSSALTALALALLLAPPAAVSAQLRPRSAPGSGWAPPQVGVHFGYDYNSTGSVAGAQMRIPILPNGFVELVPNGDITFLTGLKEYQYGVDAVVLSGGRRGGLYIGGGLVWRDTIYPDNTSEGISGRTTKRWADVVAGLRTGQLGVLPITTQIEIRWVFVDAPVKPRYLTLGFNLPLWGWEGGGR
jgi:hypothetical protein